MYRKNSFGYLFDILCGAFARQVRVSRAQMISAVHRLPVQQACFIPYIVAHAEGSSRESRHSIAACPIWPHPSGVPSGRSKHFGVRFPSSTFFMTFAYQLRVSRACHLRWQSKDTIE